MRIADAHRAGKRFVVRADEKLTAFFELASACAKLKLKASKMSQSSLSLPSERSVWASPLFISFGLNESRHKAPVD
jgi:hypothetical protein